MRSVVCADATVWMADKTDVGAVVTSLPDADEVGLDPVDWTPWFVDAATRCMAIATAGSAAIFYQTDRKAHGQLFSKAALLFEAQRKAGVRLLWHKIVLRRGAGMTDLRRPAYTHMLAFSQEGRPGKPTADVVDLGPIAYANGMNLRAALMAVDFVAHSATLVCDPFCGRGTVLAAAEHRGLDAIGVDIDPAQIAIAERLRVVRAGEHALAP